MRSTACCMRLADTIEKQVELRRKVKSAMTYPVVVAVLVLIIVTAMLLFVIPMFKNIYKELGGTLPAPTQILINISNVCRKFWYADLRRRGRRRDRASGAGSTPKRAASSGTRSS